LGLLAVQTGLVDRSDLVAAFGNWVGDKTRPLAGVLRERGLLDTSSRALLEGLAAEHLKRHGGDVRSSLAALPAGRSTLALLEQVADADLNATLTHVGSASRLTEPGSGEVDRTTTFAVGEATAAGRRFRVLRPHARGGLGAVFVALDTELHREVALKQILERHADDAMSRARFLAEAEITGGLEHPGIVPVYGLGTYGDGRPYYAMRFIRGDSLKQAIERFHAEEPLNHDPGRRSMELRQLLRRFLDVCNAIDYAHNRGVLHRDLKPGNVIVGRYGETLVVDWGMAKLLGRAETTTGAEEPPLTTSSASGSAQTAPGSVLGTPAYMSPEQAVGDLDRLGPRSDVYGLGAMLYCLLTGKPPFEGEVGDVLRAVPQGTFPPPRQLDPTLDRALEAVCLKAMARQPEDRYGSARALADDVERWLADEPVTARREPVSARLGRWARRHRAPVTGAAVLLVATTLALAIGALLLGRANARTELRRQEAERNFELARAAVDRYYTRVSEDRLLNEPQMDRLRKDLLETRAYAPEFRGIWANTLNR
jgi:serine/threonine-protein kinase